MSNPISFTHKGDFKKTERFLNFLKGRNYLNILANYGEKGVAALESATPKDTGLTAASWNYEIIQNENSVSIRFNNTNISKGYANIAILLEYGHGTRNGGYVVGRHYISPTIIPILEELAAKAWKEVMNA